jgi:hypothetical protein
MNGKKRILSLPPQRKRLKWWFKNNYIYLIIVGGVCLAAALILIFKVSRFERTRNMEALLQKSRRQMHWGGITDQDVEVLKKRYPNINWNNQFDRDRWLSGQQDLKEKQNIKGAKRKFRQEE